MPRKGQAPVRPSPVKLVASRPANSNAGHNADGGSFDGAKRSFLAAMSHELRTPLNAIIGFAEIMEAEILGSIEVPEYRDYVRHIKASGRRLLGVIEDVLDISQAEAGDLVLAKREVEVADLIDRCRAPFEAQCLLRNIRIIDEVGDHLIIRVDPPRIERAISCLLSNAVKFSSDGGTIRIAAALGADGKVKISIGDDGPGMAASAIERAFAPFVQLDDRLSRSQEGAGLGLPLARLLAELHGGTISVRSRPGRGTDATLELPAYSDSAKAVRSGPGRCRRRQD